MTESPRVDMAVEVMLRDGMRFDAAGRDGVSVTLDADMSVGGNANGFRPLELLLVGLGGCAAMDVISILRKKHQHVTRYLVEVSATQADTHPHVFTAIRMLHVIEGDRVEEEAVQRAIQLSETTYCSAYAMLSKAAPIESAYEIHQTLDVLAVSP